MGLGWWGACDAVVGDWRDDVGFHYAELLQAKILLHAHDEGMILVFLFQPERRAHVVYAVSR
jgi:hypothetical protein